jgi:hypothetical protein
LRLIFYPRQTWDDPMCWLVICDVLNERRKTPLCLVITVDYGYYDWEAVAQLGVPRKWPV